MRQFEQHTLVGHDCSIIQGTTIGVLNYWEAFSINYQNEYKILMQVHALLPMSASVETLFKYYFNSKLRMTYPSKIPNHQEFPAINSMYTDTYGFEGVDEFMI